jgi:tetratricopeptide (TPR) repeat protein
MISTHRLFWLAASLFCVSALPARACLQDRDTVAVEMAGLPDVAQAISGHFIANPPLYYQMRIDRIQAKLAHEPITLSEYDDAAVASDRLGKDDEAIAWIEKKHRLLPAYDPGNAPMKEQWYRYYANTGTFWAHRWLRAGASPATASQMDTAVGDIQRAIAIKPNAHFGREGCQLVIMQWIADTVRKRKANGKPLSDVQQSDAQMDLDARLQREAAKDHFEILKGLCGLIVLGNAWESPDVFNEIALQLRAQDRYEMGGMAYARAYELEQTGHRSIVAPEEAPTGPMNDMAYGILDPDIGPKIGARYREYRSDAERWRASRDKYMMSRMTRGDHPDTDPNFWDGYREPASTAPKPSWIDRLEYAMDGERQSSANPALLLAGGVFIFALALYGRDRFLSRRRAARKSS